MNGDSLDVREELSRWLGSISGQSAEFERCVRRLTESEERTCDLFELAWLCHGLEAARAADHIGREELRSIVDAVAHCGTRVHALRRTQLDRLIGNDINLEILDVQLLELAGRLRVIEPNVDRPRQMPRDLFRAALVHYVRERSGAYRDEEVSGLITAVERSYYTTQAHTQWRTRAAADGLLNGPSGEVLELLEEMHRELEQ